MTVLAKVRSTLLETWKLTDVSEEYIASIFRVESKPRKIPAWSRQQADFCLLPASCWYLPWLILSPSKWSRHVPSKCRLTARRYIPEDRTLHSHCCENFKCNRNIDSKKYWSLRWKQNYSTDEGKIHATTRKSKQIRSLTVLSKKTDQVEKSNMNRKPWITHFEETGS
jgi:hypothetical protein